MLVGDVLMSSEENELFTEVGELGRLLVNLVMHDAQCQDILSRDS